MAVTGTKISDYPIKHGGAESERLNAQHEAFVASVGYVLHPRINASLSAREHSPEIIDVATGTGAWLLALEVERTNSSPPWTFTGADIDLSQFPASKMHKSVKLDILEPIPDHLQGTFDVVHIRFLFAALATNHWSFVAKNAFDLLKPGGWLQWHELDCWSIKSYPSSPDPAPVKALETLFRTVLDNFSQLGRYMEQDMPLFLERVAPAGFEELEVHVASSDRVVEARAPTSLSFVEATRAGLKHLAQFLPGSTFDEDDVDEWADSARAELANAYVRFDHHILTGRKGL